MASGNTGQVWFTFDEGWANTYAVRNDYGAVPKMWEIETPEGKGIEGKKWKMVQVSFRMYFVLSEYYIDSGLSLSL